MLWGRGRVRAVGWALGDSAGGGQVHNPDRPPAERSNTAEHRAHSLSQSQWRPILYTAAAMHIPDKTPTSGPSGAACRVSCPTRADGHESSRMGVSVCALWAVTRGPRARGRARTWLCPYVSCNGAIPPGHGRDGSRKKHCMQYITTKPRAAFPPSPLRLAKGASLRRPQSWGPHRRSRSGAGAAEQPNRPCLTTCVSSRSARSRPGCLVWPSCETPSSWAGHTARTRGCC